MRDVVFLLGAGASFGAGGVLPERPPLGDSLFSELERLFPASWGALPVDLKEALRARFEDGMAGVAKYMASAVPQLMRDMAIYFVQFRIADERCLYTQLLNAICDRNLLNRVAFSTLNYDCLLEQAVSSVGAQIHYFSTRDEAAVPVLKLHGSCNMFAASLQASQGVYYQDVVFEGGIQAFSDANVVIDFCLNRTGLAPVMAQFMEGKPTSVSPRALADLQQEWAKAIESAKTVVCIGVRPHVPDKHVWDPLSSASARLLFVGDQAALNTWADVARRGKETALLGRYFALAFNEVIRELEAL